MIYRHHIAPPRAFTQFSHDLIRHPRLSSDAVRLLTWQLSLPEGAREPLSRTAERANIGGCAFTRAKRQLKAEGFVHERRLQGPGGRWVTQQLVSSIPLNEAEAAKILARLPVAVAAAVVTPVSPVSSQVGPSPRIPAVGEPTPPLSDGYPNRTPGENTSHQPPEPPAPEPGPDPEPDGEPEPEWEREQEPEPAAPPLAALEAARALAATFPHLSPDLRAMQAELTRLTARWLAAGHAPTAVRTHILRGLPDDGTPVHRPGGLLRHLLRDVPAVPAPKPPPPPAAEPPSTADITGPRVSPRLTGAQECEGPHIQPMLFRPLNDETRCPRCTARPGTPAHAGPAPQLFDGVR
ncbi:hypothetical protein ABT300_00990 [Streptomyces sp. NPDC001027]|uniref:hypothetical protein n=1 Tax=Streptomyces sp. NPDC001027 TaxID=3154771 RepID=UPI0033172A37